jgi:superoxide dismutase, Cu-Zn family
MERQQRRRRARGAAAAAVAAGGLVMALVSADPAAGHGWGARAVLRDTAGNKVGTVRFDGDEQGTDVKVTLHGITTGTNTFHGIHVHANDSVAPCDPLAAQGPFTNVGGHWNLTGGVHGAHTGDLPSVLVQADGTATARSVSGRIDPSVIAGRAVILHAGPDNFANVPTRYTTGAPPVAGPDAATYATGDAGGRIACGVITLD